MVSEMEQSMYSWVSYLLKGLVKVFIDRESAIYIAKKECLRLGLLGRLVPNLESNMLPYKLRIETCENGAFCDASRNA